MANIPTYPKIKVIEWFEAHADTWSISPTTFGVTAGQITALSNAVSAARDAYTAAQNARMAAKAATILQDEQIGMMLEKGRDTVNVIKAFIENSNNPALWGQAGLEPPAPPGTAPSPVAPTQLSAGLDSQGNVIVRWRVTQPRGVSGVIYSVRRAIDGGDFELLDSVGGKQFIDETVPVGTRSVTYAIKAKRGTTASGWSDALDIRFGRVGGGGGGGSGGLSIVSTSTTPASRLAA